jgi:hypothetical protein
MVRLFPPNSMTPTYAATVPTARQPKPIRSLRSLFMQDLMLSRTAVIQRQHKPRACRLKALLKLNMEMIPDVRRSARKRKRLRSA